MRDSMSATSVLFIDYLEKERTDSRESDSDDQEEPDERVSIDPIPEENRRRQYNHREVDSNESDKSRMSTEP